MSGQLLVGPPDEPLSPHVRVRFAFADGGPELRFVDQRTFGHLLVSPGGAGCPRPIAHIAPDPLDAAFDPDRLRRPGCALAATGIKRALLDQSLVSGIGNIYADEALWRAKLHWARAADRLAPARWPAARRRPRGLRRGAEAGGTSFDACTSTSTGRAATSTGR